MLRPLLVAIGTVLAIAGLVVFLLTRGGTPDVPGMGGTGQDATSPAEARAAGVEPRTGDVASLPDPMAEPGADRVEVPAVTALSGSFVAPTGSWPGGGDALLVPRADPPEGGMMGLFSAGMEVAREGQDGTKSERGKEIERSMIAWLGRAEPVSTARIDPRGRFEFRDPPAGDWAIELRHDSLRHQLAAPVEVVLAEHRDVGALGTEIASSVLVVVSDQEGVPISAAKVRVGRDVDPAMFMDPNALRDLGAIIRSIVPMEAETDENGRCVLRGLDAGEVWNLDVDKRGFVAGHEALPVAAGQQSIVRVTLDRGASLSVAVRGPDGRPFADGRLRLVYPDILRAQPGSPQIQIGGPGGGGQGPLGFGLETGVDGVARRAGLPSGRAELRLVTPGFRRAVRELAIPVSGEVEQEFVLDVGASVAGTVVDEDGRPVEGAHVLSMAALGQSVMGMEIESIVGLDLLTIGAEDRGVSTDADGRFVFGGFDPDGSEVHLAAVAPGFDPARVDAVVGDRDVGIRLLRACVVSGRVVDGATGEPITAFAASLQQRQFLVIDRAVVSRRFDAAVDGAFEVSPAPRQSFELVVEADGYAAFSTGVDLGEGSFDCGTIELELPAIIEGVTIGPDGVPVAGAKVRAAKGGPADSMFLAQILGTKHVESGVDGRFRMEGLTGRAVRLLVDADGFAPLRSKAIRIASGETVDGVVLQLTKGGSIRGQIVDGDDAPLVGWQVQCEHAGGIAHAFARTDAAGAFLLEGLASGTYKVTGLPADYMQRNQWRPTDPSEFGDFDLGAMITQATEMAVEDRVVVRDGEESAVTLVHEGADPGADGALVTVTGGVRTGGAALGAGMLALYPSGSTMPRHIADVKDGRFRLDRVHPGTYRVQARSGLLSGDLGHARTVVIPARPTYELQLDLPGGALAGRVVDAETREPIAGALLTLSRPGVGGAAATERMDVGEGAALTDAGGRFRFDGLEDGVYEVFAKQWAIGAGGGLSGRLSAIQVGSGEVRDGLELALSRGGALHVMVRDDAGPRANALVMLLGVHGDPLDLFHRTLTDRDGVAEFIGLPDGAYRASVDAPGAAPTVSESVDVRGGEASVDVLVRVGVPVTLTLVGEVPDPWRGEVLMYSVWRQDDGALLRGGRIVVPPAGALEASARRGLSVGTYVPGTYRLRVEGARFGVFDATRTVPPGGPADWPIDVDRLRQR